MADEALHTICGRRRAQSSGANGGGDYPKRATLDPIGIAINVGGCILMAGALALAAFGAFAWGL